VSTSTSSTSWWRDRRARERVAVCAFAALALAGILFGGFAVLLRGDVREMVVTLENGAGQQAREGLKAECGDLPGVSVVPDRGNPDPRIQGRFPVRFGMGGITDQEQSALIRCLNENRERFQIVGYLPERDGN
jgi:hypothetical protein